MLRSRVSTALTARSYDDIAGPCIPASCSVRARWNQFRAPALGKAVAASWQARPPRRSPFEASSQPRFETSPALLPARTSHTAPPLACTGRAFGMGGREGRAHRSAAAPVERVSFGAFIADTRGCSPAGIASSLLYSSHATLTCMLTVRRRRLANTDSTTQTCVGLRTQDSPTDGTQYPETVSGLKPGAEALRWSSWARPLVRPPPPWSNTGQTRSSCLSMSIATPVTTSQRRNFFVWCAKICRGLSACAGEVW